MTKLASKNCIDIQNNQTTAQALNKLEELLENNEYLDTAVSINVGKLVFTPGHMSKLKSILNKKNLLVKNIYTTASQTQLSALNLGFTVSEKPIEEVFLEEYKNSLNNSIQNIDKAEHNDTKLSEEDIKNIDLAKQIEKISNKDHNDEILHNLDKTTLPYTDINNIITNNNDVIEFINDNKSMVQEKISLPFEAKPDMTKSFKLNSGVDLPTLYINQTLRSGQYVTYEGHIVIAGDVHPGSEIVAAGDIIVWGTLGGIAHAGANNNYKAAIRALKMNPIQLRIADYIARKPDKSNFNRELTLKPEVARISGGEIRIFSLK